MQNLTQFIDGFAKELNRQSCALDQKWIKRKRVFTTKLVFNAIFMMVMDKSATYKQLSNLLKFDASFVNEKIPNFAASSFSKVRRKVSPYIFVDLSQWVYAFAAKINPKSLWFGFSTFAVDSTHITLPVELEDDGFGQNEDGQAFYPTGLLTTIYDLRLGMTYDSIFSQHNSERGNAMILMKGLPENSLLVGDRGFFSFEMLYEAQRNNVDVLFRISAEHSPEEVRDLLEEDFLDRQLTITPSIEAEKKALKAGLVPFPVEVRIVKAVIKGKIYILLTTVLDRRIKRRDILKLYESRWDIEESYKLIKAEFKVEKFKCKHTNGILQEIFATILLANLSQALVLIKNGPKSKEPERQGFSVLAISKAVKKAYFGIIAKSKSIKAKIIELLEMSISLARFRFRPGRSFPRNFFWTTNPWTKYAKGTRR